MKKIIFAAVVAGAFVMASCGGSQNSMVTKGSRSKFDTLSYAVGVNLSSMAVNQLADLPLDYDALVSSLVKSAKGESKVSHEEATEVLQDYFMTKRQDRLAAVEQSRNAADSVALANGAEAAAVREARAKMGADESMFEDAAECKMISEALGNDLGNSILRANIPVQTIWVEQAFADVVAGEPKITDAAANKALQDYFTVVLPKINAEKSDEWMASIEKNSGVQKTESGLLYKVEDAGDESIMAVDDRDVVRVKYTGRNREDKVFDSSRIADMSEDRLEYMKSQSENGEITEEDEIVEFPLNRVIPGWAEGIKLVGKGGRISLWIPYDLAYGVRGAGADIAANESIYFDVELIDVIPFEAEQE